MINFLPFTSFFNSFRYEKLPKRLIEHVIKAGTFYRTMLPVFIPLCMYQYIRQVDKERYAEELLFESAPASDVKSFYDSTMKSSGTKNWKIQYDLYLIDKAVNS
ncbi:conserved Plasmodium protein, unknown function [Plasmodium vivax]|uniref:Uncharacterized protein n=5 Tax=Plasmodium vivax TaxID=5855 RepID=A5K309_PLAVS|nr:hypothetical protein, conserved [Plasmodium vivax]KMZ79041.1 hypothetical protein PVIIG_05958 [Plasmodium vivax India VII]KMZ84992.1 hypothetical protein PVBG_01391 [Plasmodium vivax Brazil I]KMZ97968.1 hypothetical protein PVNG_00306 [Plasmodium vivax North Korean]EDL45913.1 hypothetical protein, conserved [Plasmodium vivax]CAG9473505.1 unnamed protein product [Plasmodium vivax]|eukprot:XP_001615640.1 hypothetical protein [Plasmodium vivax Sal-1]